MGWYGMNREYLDQILSNPRMKRFALAAVCEWNGPIAAKCEEHDPIAAKCEEHDHIAAVRAANGLIAAFSEDALFY